jgi:hypothetical protein
VKRITWIAVFGLAIGMIPPSLAQAEGGSSIAAAPVVKLGSRESGDTANGLHVFDNVSVIQGWNSFWRIKVKTGTKLRINWGAAPKSGTHINLFPGTTNDYSVSRAKSLAYEGQNPEGKNVLVYEATSSGSLILDLRTQAAVGTAYSFTVRRVSRH